MLADLVFTFRWGNNERRAQLKGRCCVVEARGTKNTVLVRFLDTGERVTTSWRALAPFLAGVDDEATQLPLDMEAPT